MPCVTIPRLESEDIWHPSLMEKLKQIMVSPGLLILSGPEGVGKKTLLRRWYKQHTSMMPWASCEDPESLKEKHLLWTHNPSNSEPRLLFLEEKSLVPETQHVLLKSLRTPHNTQTFLLCLSPGHPLAKTLRPYATWIPVPLVSHEKSASFFSKHAIPHWISELCWGVPGRALHLPEDWYHQREAPFLHTKTPLFFDEKAWSFAELWLLKRCYTHQKIDLWRATHRLFQQARLGQITNSLFFEMFWILSNK